MRVRELNDYRVIYKPDHPSSMTSDNWNGFVYEHIYIMEMHLGRCLIDDEVVHHLDGNRKNNALDNLLLLTRDMHVKIHAWIDRDCPYKTPYNEAYCDICGIFLYSSNSDKYCSPDCSALGRRKSKDRPSKKDLVFLLKHSNYTRVAGMYGVSDNAVRKWVKSYGLNPKTLEPL